MLNKEIREDRFTFTHTGVDNENYTMALHGEKTVNQLLEYFLMFMKGCGYQFRLNDRLELIDGDEETSSKDTDHFIPLDDVIETSSEEEQKEMQAIVQRWKDNELDKTNYVSTTAFDDQFRSDPMDALIENEKAAKLADTILPFLHSLKVDPDKSVIRWANREEIVNSKIKEIEKILGE
jgi:hypothetical protein